MQEPLKELVLSVALLTLLVVGCGPSATPVPPTPVPPTATLVPPTLVPLTATPAPVSMSVTFAGDKCTMRNAPQKVAVGTTLAIDWVLGDNNYDFPGLCAVTMDPGKTVEDLNAAPAFPAPSWVHVYYCWQNPGKGKTVYGELKTGPVYLLCYSSHTAQIGTALGPIEVAQ